MGGDFTTPSFAAPRHGLEDGVVRNLKDLELVYFKDSALIESIDELAMMAMKGGDLDDADRAAISRMRSTPPVEAKIPEQSRFVVRAKVGYDNGAGTRDLGVIGESNDLKEAKAIRDKYRDDKAIHNTQAAYDYAEVEDRLDEHAVVGFGKYGNGTRITSIRSVISLCETDDILFRGSHQECLKRQEEYEQGKVFLQKTDQGEQLAVFGPSGAGHSGLKLEMFDILSYKPAQDIDTIFSSSAKLGIEMIEIAGRVEYLALQSEREHIERDIAIGRDTPEGDARLQEIERIMDASPWTLHPDRGCVRKEGTRQLESRPDAPALYMMGSTAVFAPSGVGKSFVERELRNGGEEPDDEQPAERPRM